MKSSPINLGVIRNPLAADVEWYEGDNIEHLLRKAFGGESLSKNVHIFKESVVESSRVPLETIDDVNKLSRMTGNIFAVVMPMGSKGVKMFGNSMGGKGGGGKALLISLGIGIVVALAARLFAKKFKIPNITNNYNFTNQISANNMLSQRANDVRIGGRVPDIYGEVWSFPDHIAKPYTVYVNNVEHEYCMMCVGRGVFNVSSNNVYEDDTAYQDILGATLEYYHPRITENGTLGNSNILTDAPAMRIGEENTGLSEAMSRYSVKYFEDANNRLLEAPNTKIEDESIYFYVETPLLADSSIYGKLAIASSSYDLQGNILDNAAITIKNAKNMQGTLPLRDENGEYIFAENGGYTYDTYNLNGTYKAHHISAGNSYMHDSNNEVKYVPSRIWLEPINLENQASYDKFVKKTRTQFYPSEFTFTKFLIEKTEFAGWQGWFYTDAHIYNELWVTLGSDALYAIKEDGSSFAPLLIYSQAQVDLLDDKNNVLQTQHYSLPLVGGGHQNYWNFQAALGDNYAPPITETTNATGGYLNFGNQAKVREPTGYTYRISLASGFEIDNLQKAYRARIRVRRVTRLMNGGVDKGEFNKAAEVGKSPPKTPLTYYQDIKIVNIMGADNLRLFGEDGLGFTGKDIYRPDCTVVYTTQKNFKKTESRERKLRMKVNRLVGIPGYEKWFDSRFAEIAIPHILLDYYSGNVLGLPFAYATDAQRIKASEAIDLTQMGNEMLKVREYFGYEKAGTFNFTFDSSDMSAENMVGAVADAAFSQVRRVNGKFTLNFEASDEMPVANFNSHNILPNTFTKTETCGFRKDFDGVEVRYRSPIDAKERILRYPDNPNTPPLNAEKVDLYGVTDKTHAYLHMMRRYNRMAYGYRQIEFNGADETNIITVGDTISVADQTIQNPSDYAEGNVVALNGNVLVTDRKLNMVEGSEYVIFVQTTAGIVESIACTPNTDNSVTLASIPLNPISTDPNAVVRATYQIVPAQNNKRLRYIVTNKDNSGYFQHKISAVISDSRFYQNDKDVINGTLPQGISLND